MKTNCRIAMVVLMGLCACLLAAQHATAQDAPEETTAARDARMQWWREARFGMFIHWGVYAVPAGTYKGKQIGGIGEWIMLRGRIPVDDYRAFAKDFNPVKYDPDAWVRLAKEAGMKYIVITSKHHDGFALFESKVTDWDVVDATPYGKDLLKPLAEACRKHGLKLGFYYSQAQDWTHPGGAPLNNIWDPARKGDMDAYIREIAAPQVREILTNYGDVAVLWWDTPRDMTTERADLLRPLLKLQPHIITNNRLGGGYKGDTDTPEQHIPATGIPGRDWETCMTMNRTWGYKSYDHDWKPVNVLIQNLVDIASKGGNYLLNVGPTALGEIPQPSIDRLKALGKWMDMNGDAIYGTAASPCKKPDWGRITTKRTPSGAILYLHVFDWPADGELHVPLSNRTGRCYLLADLKREFTAKSGEKGITVTLTGGTPDPISSTVVLQILGEPEVIVHVIRQQKDGTVALLPQRAHLDGKVRTEEKDRQTNIGFWTSAKDTVTWTFEVTRPDTFELSTELGGTGKSQFTIEVGDQQLNVSTGGSGSYDVFKPRSLGRIRLAVGKHKLRLVPVADQWSPVNMRALTLTPEDTTD